MNPNGFNALSKEIQDDIFYMIAIKYKMTEICKKHNLNYKTYLGWNKKKSIPSIPEYILDKVKQQVLLSFTQPLVSINLNN